MKPTRILGQTRRSDISFHLSGKIELSSRIVRALGISPGDVIDIMTSNAEFYLFVALRAASACGRHEAACYPSNRSGRHYRASSVRLCRAILARIPNDGHARFPAGDPTEINGIKAIPIITKRSLSP